MTEKPDREILFIPIPGLDVSPDFKAMALQNGYYTIADILKSPITNFHAQPGSGYRLLKELLQVLHRHDLTDLIDD